MAGPLRDALNSTEEEKEALFHTAIRTHSNLAYGSLIKERLDVYMPEHLTQHVPVLFMVHGGAWMIGDKKHQSVIENKVAYWVEKKGYIVVSINYPMLPSTPVNEQLYAVAKALGYVQAHCEEWGGDKNKVVLMGHSAGAHLIALLAANDALYQRYAITPPKAAVFLDSAVMNTPVLMQEKHLRLYDRAFGNNPTYWQSLSPYHQLNTKRMAMLAVCSTQREDSCPQAKAFLDKATSLGTITRLVSEPLSHKDINVLLGQDLTYTKIVDDFLNNVGVQ